MWGVRTKLWKIRTFVVSSSGKSGNWLDQDEVTVLPYFFFSISGQDIIPKRVNTDSGGGGGRLTLLIQQVQICIQCISRHTYVCGIQVLWGEGWLGEKSPNRLLRGTVMEKSLRKLFCDEGLAFKTGQPFAVGPLQDAFKEFSWTWGGQLLLDTCLNERNRQSEFVLLSSVDLSTRRPGSTISGLRDTQKRLPASLVCVYHL